ncbi:MAG: hypothetical protein NTW55_06625 [Planctomycetota bacterium]|nr:hypothetical protein [Planctomycetota bacterium]
MKTQKINSICTTLSFLIVVAAVVLTAGVSLGDWLKMNPPPDLDKAEHAHGNKPTCWMCAAANMLAGAGYGDGNNVQERADDVYDEMIIHFGANNSGWTDTAITWWLQDANNTWKNTNPYNVQVIHGDPNCKIVRYPWRNTEIPKFVANRLRACNMIQLSIRKPTWDANVGCGGHSVTAWGDANDANTLTGNPDKVKITDSDYWDITQNVQTYTYDDYNNPNPGDCNEGKGFYFNYSNVPHWYIDHVLTLSPADSNNPLTQTVVGSYKVTQDMAVNALDFHSKTSVGSKILTYRVAIDWDTNNIPTITEEPNKKAITINYNLIDHNVPTGTAVTLTAELVTPYDANDPNGSNISMTNTYFTYPISGTPKPDFTWRFRTPLAAGGTGMNIPNMCGGYAICSFSIYSDPGGTLKVGEFRSQHEYKYYQTPEYHEWFIEPNTPIPPYFVGYFHFGHSYALLSDKDLWQFNNWMTNDYPVRPLMPSGWTPILWAGRLPYPKGQDFTNPTPQKCGDPGTWYVSGDINKDCRVDFKDMAIVAGTWLRCTDPQDANCW